MALKRLLELKKRPLDAGQKLYKKHLIVGENLFCLCLYHQLVKKWGREQVALLCESPLDRADAYPIGPNTLRGEDNIEAMAKLFPRPPWNRENGRALFFKELKWHSFGGRTRPAKLLENEAFFTWPKAEFDIEMLYPFLSEDNFFTSLKNQCLTFSLKNLTCGVPPFDLVEPHHFVLDGTPATRVGCEFLYWGRPFKDFVSVYQRQNQRDKKWMQLGQTRNSQSALYARFLFERPITDKCETLFIPLSYTHDQGHFIGEFKRLKEGRQRADFVVHLDLEHTSEEQVSAKLRFLKRSLNKIFKDFSSTPHQTFVKLRPQLDNFEIDDPSFQEMWERFPNLRMIGPSAPLKANPGLKELSFFARGALSLNQTLSAGSVDF